MCVGVGWSCKRAYSRTGHRIAALAADIDLGALGRALWRKKFLILGLTLFAAAIAFVAVNLITPRYKSEARVLVETRENIFFRPDAEKSRDRATTVDQEAVTSQVQLVLSRDLAREVIKKLKLGERPEFDPVLDGPSLLRTRAYAHGHRQKSAGDDARGAGVQELLRPTLCLPGREVAGHRDRVRIAGSGACRASRECGGRGLSALAASGKAGTDSRGRCMALRRDRAAARQSGQGGGQGRAIPRKDQSLHR